MHIPEVGIPEVRTFKAPQLSKKYRLLDNLQPTVGPKVMLCGELDPIKLGASLAVTKFHATSDGFGMRSRGRPRAK